MIPRTERFHPNLEARKAKGAIAYFILVGAVAVGILGLAVLLIQVFMQGVDWLRPELIFNFPSRFPEQAGLKAALFGTLWLMGLTALFCVPVGIGAAIYLEEYAAENRLTQFIEINIANLAGVPSIVYGLLGAGTVRSWVHIRVRWDQDRVQPRSQRHGRGTHDVAARSAHRYSGLS